MNVYETLFTNAFPGHADITVGLGFLGSHRCRILLLLTAKLNKCQLVNGRNNWGAAKNQGTALKSPRQGESREFDTHARFQQQQNQIAVQYRASTWPSRADTCYLAVI